MVVKTKTKASEDVRMPGFPVRMEGVQFMLRFPEPFNQWLTDYLSKTDYATPMELVRELLQECKAADKQRGKLELAAWLETYLAEEGYTSTAELVRDLLRQRKAQAARLRLRKAA